MSKKRGMRASCQGADRTVKRSPVGAFLRDFAQDSADAIIGAFAGRQSIILPVV
jgi:hypothetical protein